MPKSMLKPYLGKKVTVFGKHGTYVGELNERVKGSGGLYLIVEGFRRLFFDAFAVRRSVEHDNGTICLYLR